MVLEGSDYRSTLGRLNIADDTKALALQILERCHTSELEGHQERLLWLASAVYIADSFRWTKGDSDEQARARLSLPQLLSGLRLGLAEFLKELPGAIKRAEPSLALYTGEDAPLDRRVGLRELQTNFVYSTVLVKKCKDMFRRYFSVSHAASKQPPAALQLCWMLFLVSKRRLLPQSPDLVSAFSLLVCVVNVLLVHTAAKSDALDGLLRSQQESHGPVSVLQALTSAHKANWSSVQALMAGLDGLMREFMAEIAPGGELPPSSAPDGDGKNCTIFPGLLTDPAMTTHVIQSLDEAYSQDLHAPCDIDERDFLTHEAEPAHMHPPQHVTAASVLPSLSRCHVSTPMRASPHATMQTIAATPVHYHSILSPMYSTPSPVRAFSQHAFATPGRIPATPVGSAMAASTWLHDLAASMSLQPSAELRQYFAAAGPDVEGAVLHRLNECAAAAFPAEMVPEPINYLSSCMSTERRHEGMKLYLRLLEAMLRSEFARASAAAFTNLLLSDSFHKCLMACAFEVVFASYRMVSVAFPAVLERLQLQAFDMCKMIDAFVRHEPLLMRELRRHLFSVDERILESLAWKPGSSLYPLIALACSTAAATEEPALQTPRGGQSAPSAHSTPTKRKGEDVSPDATPAKVQKSEGNSPQTDSQQPESGSSNGSSPIKSPGREATVTPCSAAPRPAPANPSIAPLNPPADPAKAGSIDSVTPTGGGLLSPKRQSDCSAFSAFLSPLSPSQHSPGSPGAGIMQLERSLPLAFAADGTDVVNTHAARPGRMVLAEFLRRLLRLSALRLADLCERMDFHPLEPGDILTQVYTMVHHVVYVHTALLFNRHLDQILLSSLYSVCKVNSVRQASFKEMLQHYRRQPQCKTEVFRTVVIEQSLENFTVTRTGDIIEFYNAVLIPALKTFVLDLGAKRVTMLTPPVVPGGGRLLGSPVKQSSEPILRSSFATPPPSDRISRPDTPSSAHKSATVFVSPLRRLTPQKSGASRLQVWAARMGESLQEYCSPACDLDAINDRLRAPRPVTPAQRSLTTTTHAHSPLAMQGGAKGPARSPRSRALPARARPASQPADSDASTAESNEDNDVTDEEDDDSQEAAPAPAPASTPTVRSLRSPLGSPRSPRGARRVPLEQPVALSNGKGKRGSAKAVAADSDSEGEHVTSWQTDMKSVDRNGMASGLFLLNAAVSALEPDNDSEPHSPTLRGRGTPSRPAAQSGDITPSRSGRIRRAPNRTSPAL